MDTSIALTTQITVLPEAGGPKMLGKKSRSPSNSHHPLLTSPLETVEPSRIRLLPFTSLARVKRDYTPAINSQKRYYWVRKPSASSPLCSPQLLAEVPLGDETDEDSHTGNPPFLQGIIKSSLLVVENVHALLEQQDASPRHGWLSGWIPA